MFLRTYLLSLMLAAIIQGMLVQCQDFNARLDCYPIEGATKEKCEALGCKWSPVNEGKTDYSKSRVNEPWCYFPEGYIGYEVYNKEYSRGAEGSGTTFKILFKRVRPSSLGNDVQKVGVEISSLNRGNLLRLRMTDDTKSRYEPELPRLNYSNNSGQFNFDHIELVDNKLTIRRGSSGAVLFSTDMRRLIFSDRFIQLNSKLGSPFLYGLGEHYDNFLKQADQFKTYSLWSTDRLPTPDGQRSYGGFPFYINLDRSNNAQQFQAHGVYLHNSNAMDIVLQSDSSITFRTTGGILDYFMFVGPEPLDVVSQFQHLVGLPELPPRWALGFHLCRYNYGTLNKTKAAWERTRAAGIPFDTQWNDIDYMWHYNDFTYDPVNFAGLPEFVDDLHHKHKMHYMLIFDPGLSQESNYYPYEMGQQMDIWIRNATNQTLVGKVWNQSGRTVFPDFSNPASHDFWSKLFVDFQQELKFDGAWIDMNDISNFVDGSLDGCPKCKSGDSNMQVEASIEDPPYKPGGYNLQHHSLCLSAKHFNDRLEYDLHNLYSFYEAIATKKALEAARPNKRSLVISRSTYSGQGHYSGHWSGDILSNWDYLKWSIPSLLEHSMYGFSMMGSDICGFSGNTTPELCARWSTLGAFYTFSRNHNDDKSIDQDPAALGSDVIAANKNAYRKKYALLPYLYTLLHEAHRSGVPVARSLSFEFFKQQDNQLLTIETQFMIGSALMISPIVEEKTFSVQSYLPKGRWYETNILPETADRAPNLIDSTGSWLGINNVTLDNLVIFVRGGHIIPYYSKVGPTTTHTVEGQPISLEVALCHMSRAKGRLIHDDGETIDSGINQVEMSVPDGQTLNLTMTDDAYQGETHFGQVRIYGLNKQVSDISLRGGKKLSFIQDRHMLVFDLQGEALSKKQSLVVRWT